MGLAAFNFKVVDYFVSTNSQFLKHQRDGAASVSEKSELAAARFTNGRYIKEILVFRYFVPFTYH
jgi:hypothetical protein